MAFPVDLAGPEAEGPEELGVDLASAVELLIVVDRLKVDPDARDRLADSLGTCFVEGDGEAIVLVSERTEIACASRRGSAAPSTRR